MTATPTTATPTNATPTTATPMRGAAITDASARPVPRHGTQAPVPTGATSLRQRWSTARLRRRYATGGRRDDARDRTDRYLDRIDDTHLRQVLTAFVQR